MPYFLLIIGFALLFYYSYSKTNNKISEETLNTHNDFNNKTNPTINVVNPQLSFDKIFNIEEDLLKIKSELQDLKESINYINENYIALNDKIESISNTKFDEGTDTNKNYFNDTTKENLTIDNKIEEMLNNGYTIEEISSKLRIGRGEVLLRLGLKKPKKL
ncbi:MAG: hypothetical protein N2594_00315 [Clostridiales bacterium]|nr:hypothetical protein [Clostridiales bacterium]